MRHRETILFALATLSYSTHPIGVRMLLLVDPREHVTQLEQQTP